MDEYIGLDVSLKETAISVRRDGKRVWRGKCASDPVVRCGVGAITPFGLISGAESRM